MSGSDPAMRLYQRALGPAWARLAPQVREVHDTGEFEGRCAVERGKSLPARLIASVFRFPRAGSDVPVRVRIDAQGNRETWTRTFGESSFSSGHAAGTGRSRGLMCERFGPFNFGMALAVDGGQLHYETKRWTCLGIPLPMAIGPQSKARETVADGRFRFDVEIGHPWFGPIVSYRGWLVASRAPAANPPAPPRAR